MAKKSLAQKREAEVNKLVDEYCAVAVARKKADIRYHKMLKPVRRRTKRLGKGIDEFAEKHGFSPHDVQTMMAHRAELATRPAPPKAKPDPAPEEAPGGDPEKDPEKPKTAMAGVSKPATG